MVDMSGAVSPEILVIPDAGKLRQAGITAAELEAAIRNADVEIGSLTIRDGEYQYNVKFQSVITSRADIERILLRIHGRIYTIGDLAQVIEHPGRAREWSSPTAATP